LSTASI